MPTLVRLAYDGTDWHGCPVTPGRRTVLGAIDEALRRVGPPSPLDVLSRTDAGVHAHDQIAVVHADLDPAWILSALAHHLPADLRPRAAAQVDVVPAVVDKTYTYQLDLSPLGDPFAARTAWRPPRGVDPDRLAVLAAQASGRRDWSGFRRRGETRNDLVRDVQIQVQAPDRITLTADGFVYRLVRSLVGAMIAEARGALPPGAWEAALRGLVSAAGQQQAPACGLHLRQIRLDPEPHWLGEDAVLRRRAGRSDAP